MATHSQWNHEYTTTLTLYRDPLEQCHTTPSIQPYDDDENQGLSASALGMDGTSLAFIEPWITSIWIGHCLLPRPKKKSFIINRCILLKNVHKQKTI